MRTFTRFMGVLVIALALAIPACITTGCGTTKPAPQAIVYRTLQATQTAVDAAMKLYAQKVVLGRVSAEKQVEISNLHRQYRMSFRAAVGLAQRDYSKLTPANVQAITDSLLTLLAKL